MNSILKVALPKLGLSSAPKIQLFQCRLPAGFPSPAEDYLDKKISLDEYLIKNPSATYLARAQGHSMTGAGIMDGALLIVDRSVNASHGDIIVASLNGEFTCKYLDINNKQLVAANRRYSPIPIKEGTDFEIEGVVTHWINSAR